MSVVRTVAKVLVCGVMTQAAVAQANPEAHEALNFAFDVAAIRQNTSAGGRSHIYNDRHTGEFRTINESLKTIVEYAYDVPQSRIVGGPAWMDSAKFDIDAKSNAAVNDSLAKMSNSDADQAKRAMVRALLEDRFSVIVHREMRDMPIFNLTVAKGGPKIQKSDDGGTTWNRGDNHLELSGGDHTMNVLCDLLARVTGRVVVDKTGLDGRYKLSLKWTPEDVAAAGRSGPDAPPDLFTAIQEQLGLKLEPAKGPVPVLAIDKVTMPTEN